MNENKDIKKKKTKEERKEENKVLFRMIKEAKPIYGWLLLGCLLCLIIIACAIIIPKLIGQGVQLLYDSVTDGNTGGLVSRLIPLAIALGVTYLVSSGIKIGKMFLLNNVVSRHYTCSLRIKMSDKIRRLPIKFIDNTPAGELIEKMNDDVSTMGNTIHTVVDTLMTGFIQIIAIAVTMFMEDFRLSLIVIAFMPISIFVSAKLSGKAEKHFDSMFGFFGKLYSAVEEGYGNYQTTKAYNYEEETIKGHRKVTEELKKVSIKAVLLESSVMPCISFMNSLIYILLCLVGGILVIYKGVAVGAVVTVILFARQISDPLEQIANGLGSMQRTKSAAKRVFDVLDEKEEEEGDEHLPTEADRDHVKGNIVFDHVDFSYVPEKPLIKDLNVTVKAGQKIAIVGETGAGKTTIVNLLMRFYDLDSGRITVDGLDISRYKRSDIRDLFGMVLQDTWLFGGTISENVAYGKPDATREEIMQVCEEAYCDHFIRTLSGGYDTVIGEDISNFSGGQKQLLTIARALLADKPLLILDEATSNVDTRTELLIQKAMDKLMKGRTCFVIAHRLSTIVDADMILVLDHGNIVETGTHNTLLEKKGKYFEIYNSQYNVGL